MDTVSTKTRSKIMSCIKGKNTKPEIIVRRKLHAHGYRFRLHRKDLPGKPDIVLPKFRAVVFVNGCFWHVHDCPRGKRPSTNIGFWSEKLEKNIKRDKKNHELLLTLGWNVIVIWECQLKKEPDKVLSEMIEKIHLTTALSLDP